MRALISGGFGVNSLLVPGQFDSGEVRFVHVSMKLISGSISGGDARYIVFFPGITAFRCFPISHERRV